MQRTITAVVVIALILSLSVVSSSKPKSMPATTHRDEDQLAKASGVITESQFTKHYPLGARCSCQDYCTGVCFAPSCAPCDPSAFSFPGGESLCYKSLPVGTGLLCKIDEVTNMVTPHACCNANGPSCFLPQNSCCSGGGCATCNVTRTVAMAMLPKLNSSQKMLPTGVRRRIFYSSNSSCEFAPQ
mgnify:CR=1 FL=1